MMFQGVTCPRDHFAEKKMQLDNRVQGAVFEDHDGDRFDAWVN